jgi:hypothetical protein
VIRSCEEVLRLLRECEIVPGIGYIRLIKEVYKEFGRFFSGCGFVKHLPLREYKNLTNG